MQTIYLTRPTALSGPTTGEHPPRDVKDGKAEDATRQPEQVRAFATPGSWASTLPGLPADRLRRPGRR